MAAKVSVLFVCLGNICRSPLAEGLFRHHVEARGLAHAFEIDSAGTGAWHVGEPPDPGSVAVARKNKLDISKQRARQVRRDDLDRFDVILAMDAQNQRDLLRLAADPGALQGRLWLMRSFEASPTPRPDAPGVPDPYGGGPRGFEEVYGIVDRAAAHLLDHLLAARR